MLMQNKPSPVQHPSNREDSSVVSSGTALLGAVETSTASSFVTTSLGAS
ncbi:hypothetical protein [Corallococcus sp. AB011P]|nr:hypothetical protein [Corallococcus sp. AB011P]